MRLISDSDLDRFMAEDVPFGDLTTRSLGIQGRPARMDFHAGAEMVVCCVEEASRILSRLGCLVEMSAASGDRCDSGQLLLSARGAGGAILAGWKVAQTLMEYASGIASAAAAIKYAAGSGVVVACTRKTFPGTKAVAIKAILAGGATPHRLGLSDSLLVFPEHRSLLADEDLMDFMDRLKSACPEKKVVVEVNSVDEALAAAKAGADVVQLEKFSPALVAEAVARLDGTGAVIAAAGGINAGNAAAYAQAGARILVTSSPYSASPRDVKVTISADHLA